MPIHWRDAIALYKKEAIPAPAASQASDCATAFEFAAGALLLVDGAGAPSELLVGADEDMADDKGDETGS